MKYRRSPRFFPTLALMCLAMFAAPGLVNAAPGDLYFSEWATGNLIRIAADGSQKVIATDLHQPEGIAFDKAGNLYVLDYVNGTSVLKITRDGTKTVFASGFRRAAFLAFDPFGNLFVSDSFANTITKVAPDGAQTIFTSDVNQPTGLAFDTLGNLYEGDYTTSNVYKFSPDGTTKTLVAHFPDVPGPLGLAFDRDNNLFVAYSGGGTAGGRIAKITPDGKATTFVLTNGFPQNIAFDSGGNLFFGADYKITRVAPDATLTTVTTTQSVRDHVAFEPPVQKLLNMSARGFVGAGDNTLIAGFIVSGPQLASNAIVVRAIGPTLPQTTTLIPLQDPVLEVRNASGVLLASNDNWQDTQKAQLLSSGLAPLDPRESAIYAYLPGGNFTAVVRSASSATGTALVEVYNLN